MANLNALLVAIEAASRKRDAARKVLQDTEASQRAAHAQLDQLQGYARETQERWGVKADTTMQPEVLYHHYQFMDRLGHAATLQTAAVGDHERRVEAARMALVQAELRLASLRMVVDKRRQEAQSLQMRREQKQTDERAALKYRSAGEGPRAQEY